MTTTADLARSVRLTERMERTRRKHAELAKERRDLWLDLTRNGGVTYDEIVAACHVRKNQVSKAIRKAKDERGEP